MEIKLKRNPKGWTNCDSESIWTIKEYNNTFYLKYKGRIREYYNDGIKEGNSYIFHKDTGIGYKCRVELICYDTNEWGYCKYTNSIRYHYDEWIIMDGFGLIVQ